jgi:glycosyltransferase involved in cell wall biosynthesis
MNPTVSIIIPCYRQAQYLPDAVRSVLAQTFTDWEIIIATGCDSSTAEAQTWAGPCIRVLDGLDSGLADARNEAIEQARGHLILPLDADDMLAPTFLQRTVTAMGDLDSFAIVSTDLQEFGQRAGAWRLPPYSQAHLLESNALCVASLFPKKLWRAAGGYDVSLLGYEDWSFWISCSTLNPRVVVISELLFHYRIHADNASWLCLQRDGLLRAMVRARHPDLYDRARLEADRHTIADMPDDALDTLERRLRSFPANAGLQLFRDLARRVPTRTTP